MIPPRPKSKVKVINQKHEIRWTMYHGDCVETVKGIPTDSLHFTIFSPPFASLFVFSNSERDMGNNKNEEHFSQHFKFLVDELFRATMPGRICAFHCMNLPTSKSMHGKIGIRDFRGELIRIFIESGWIYHSEVCIWKDPVCAMQRSKSIGLLHKQVKKDSCISRQGLADYLVVMRKPGDNPERVGGMFDNYAGNDESMLARNGGIRDSADHFSIDIWQRYASPVWMDIVQGNTLQRLSAREHNDERHICPLQLQVIERAVDLWSNPGDVVFSPFAGIGSEGYQAVKMGRKFIGVELKESYYKQACLNLKAAEHLQHALI